MYAIHKIPMYAIHSQKPGVRGLAPGGVRGSAPGMRQPANYYSYMPVLYQSIPISLVAMCHT